MYGENVEVLCFELFFTCRGRICTESLTCGVVVVLALTMDENFSVRLTTCMEMI